MLSIIITAYEDPKSTDECIRRILAQEGLDEKFEIIASCPDELTKKVIFDYKRKYPRLVRYVKQDNPDKNILMNKIMKLTKGDVLIWTDGNKFVEKNAIKLIADKFGDSSVGCVGGRPVPQNSRGEMFGFWAHLLTHSAHKLREKRFLQGKFVEQCANLLAMRKGIIDEIPADVAEDAIIPYLITEKGYKNVYAGDAKVYVMYPQNFRDWIKQKVRSAKSHEAMNRFVLSKKLKQKTLFNEILHSPLFVLPFSKNPREILWTILLHPVRLYIWLMAFYEIKIKKSPYVAAWSRAESTKAMDYKK